MHYAADFESTTNEIDCRVWLWGVQEIGKTGTFYYDTDINSFLNFCMKHEGSYYFHNLKFDGIFILDYMSRLGYTWTSDRKHIGENQFYSLISEQGLFYMIKVCSGFYGGKKKFVTFYDSMKLMNMSVDAVAKTFKLPISKLDMDYDKERPIGYIPDKEELKYMKHDVGIMALALNELFEQGLSRMTIGSNSLHAFKESFGKKNFERFFPPPLYDYDIRKSYKGAFTYVNPKFKNQIIDSGLVFDVNSLYPSRMYYDLMPYGSGIYYMGHYIEDTEYPLYIQHITCQFKLKPEHFPTIQIKKSRSFIDTEYLSSSNGNFVDLCLTNVDLALFFEHYDVFNVQYNSGWKFKGRTGMFNPFIDHWMGVKNSAKADGNFGLYWIAKAMLNNLYGKFATNPETASKMPYLDKETDHIKFKVLDKEFRHPVYLPVGTFITAYARAYTIRAAQKCYDRFIYADTDSLHLVGTELPDIDIDAYRLGAWKLEGTFKKAKYLHAKCYMESLIVSDKEFSKMEEEEQKLCYLIDGTRVKDKVTIAGLPERCRCQVNYDNFQLCATYEGKLQPKIVKGGVILTEKTFTIKGLTKKQKSDTVKTGEQ